MICDKDQKVKVQYPRMKVTVGVGTKDEHTLRISVTNPAHENNGIWKNPNVCYNTIMDGNLESETLFTKKELEAITYGELIEMSRVELDDDTEDDPKVADEDETEDETDDVPKVADEDETEDETEDDEDNNPAMHTILFSLNGSVCLDILREIMTEGFDIGFEGFYENGIPIWWADMSLDDVDAFSDMFGWAVTMMADATYNNQKDTNPDVVTYC